MASDSLNTLHDKINQTKTRYNKLREEINSKLKECSDCLDTIEKLHCEVGKITVNLEEEVVNASNEKKELEDIETKLATLSTNGMIVLNVGGVKFTTRVETLTREKDTFFTALFSKQWQIEKDENDKSIFIDRNGKLFTHILEYMRTDLVPKDAMQNEMLRRSILIEAEYFRLHTLINRLDIFMYDTLLDTPLKKKLNEFYGIPNQQWELIYKASRDGFNANAFHTRCNNQGPTMTIVKSNNNYLFGGYTSVAWASTGRYGNDAAAFLFTLTNPHNIPPTKYLVKPGNAGNAVFHHNTCGPFFGTGAFSLVNNSNSSRSSIGFPNVYIDTTGKGVSTFTGANTFLTSEIEVFKLA